jgi:hypothetical protein
MGEVSSNLHVPYRHWFSRVWVWILKTNHQRNGIGDRATRQKLWARLFAPLRRRFCRSQGELNARRRQTEAIIPTIEAGSGIRLYLRTPDGNALPIHRLDDRGRETIRAMVETDRAGVSQLQLRDRDGNHVCSFQLENFLLNRFVNMDVPEPTKLTEPTSIETFAAMCGTTPEALRGAVHVVPASHTDLADSPPLIWAGFLGVLGLANSAQFFPP